MRSGTAGINPGGGSVGNAGIWMGDRLMNLMRSGTAGNTGGGFSGNAGLYTGDRLMNLEGAFIPVIVAPETIGLMNL